MMKRAILLGVMLVLTSCDSANDDDAGNPTAVAEPADLPPAYQRSATDPNGDAWPVGAAYLSGATRGAEDGLSEITIDNSDTDFDAFVKLVKINGTDVETVRQIYVPHGSDFKISKLSPGRYELRYMNLDAGTFSRSEEFDVTENETSQGTEFSIISITLYKVNEGNFQTYPMEAAEF